MLLGLLTVLALFSNVTAFKRYQIIQEAKPLNSVHFSPDVSLLAVGSQDNIQNIYSMSTLQTVYSFNAGGPVSTVRFSPNQQYLIYALQANKLVLMYTNYTIILNMTSAFSTIDQMDVNNDSTRIVVCGKSSGSNGYQIFSIPDGTLLYNDYSYLQEAYCCRFSTLNYFAVGDKHGGINYYSSPNASVWTYSTTGGGSVLAVAFSQNATLLSSGWGGGGNQNILTFNPVAVNTSNTLSYAGTKDFNGLDYSPDGFTLASGDTGGNLKVHLVSDGYRPIFNDTGLNSVNQIKYSSDNCWLAAACQNNNVYLYMANCMKNSSPVYQIVRCPIDQFLNISTLCQLCVTSMAGCRECINASYCVTCTGQFYLDSTNKCSPCTSINPACVECTNSSACAVCISTYFVDGTACSQCFAAMPGCLTCANSSYCYTCANNSYFYNTTNNNCSVCSISLPNCVDCSSSSTCISCQSSYFITATGTCSKCSLNCSTCTTNSTNCLTCDNGYYLSTTSCLPCPIICTECTAATSCTLCASGYYLSGSTCTQCSSQCQTCVNSPTNCTSCTPGYYLNGNTCSLCSTNCASCNTSASTCQTCNIGYYLSSSSCDSCTSISAQCLLCNSSVCFQCASGFFLNGSVCSSCQSAILGCELCTNNTVCLVCLQRYFLASNICTVCSWPCLTCANSTNTGCLSCAIGYFLQSTNSSCMRCSCPTCNSSTNCLSCDSDQYLSSGACYYCTNIHSYCRSCNTSTNCLDCTPPYYLNGANCSLCPSECTSCTSFTSCTTCALGYYLAATTCTLCPSICSTCFSSINCTECIDGYYLSSGSCLACTGISTGCSFCNSTVCLSCTYTGGYYLNSNVCSTCNSAMSHCLLCLANNVCTECELSYTLNNSNSSCVLCSTLIPLCQMCSSTTICTKCLSGSVFNGTLCSPCSQGCYECSSGTSCTKCLPQFGLTSTFTCTECASVLLGCDRCQILTACLQCGFGFYLSGTSCVPCLFSIAGCLACSDSLTCVSCQNGFYLDSVSKTCVQCGSTLTGCGFCRTSATCDICLSGYYLNAGQCQLCYTSNCLICNSTQCIQCISGFYLNSTTCNTCSSLFLGCIMCNSTNCQSCHSGFFINGTGCSQCSHVGCQVCNNTNSNQCLSCSSTYYLNSGSCNLCSSVLSDCIQCTPNGLSCTLCDSGYYLTGSTCSLCSVAMPNCLTCSNNVICDSCESGSLLTSTSCTLCHNLMDGCMFCSTSTACQNCQQGYYLDSNILCQRCDQMTGCLICRNANSCNYCTSGYFLQTGVCVNCNTAMPGCIACSSNTTCLACSGKYYLNPFGCTIITSNATYYPYDEVKLKSVYVNSTTLKHTLWVYGTTFTYTTFDLMSVSNISYVATRGQVIPLTITAYEWGDLNRCIIFYTNNPFDLSQYSSSTMQLFSMRLLQTSLTNIQINANFQLSMPETAVLTILPGSLHGGDLYVSYSAAQPQFVASTMLIYDYKYYYFGILVSIYLFFFAIVKGVVLDPKGKDKGQIIAHILLIKTPVLMLYPTYAELLNYCSGFMFADLPWFNYMIAGIFSDPRDNTPAPYLLFYTSLSISSTFLLPIAFIIFCYIVLGVISFFKKKNKEIIKNIALVLYNYLSGGLSFAAVACVQGAFLNPLESSTLNSASYLLGLMLFCVLLGEAVWSTCKDCQNLFKIRIILKAFLLSIMHYNTLYLLEIVSGVELFFFLMKMRLCKLNFPKLWLTSNILPNISLLLLVYLSRSLISIYMSSVLILLSLSIEVIILLREYKLRKMISEVKISETKTNKQPDNSFMKILGLYMMQADQKIIEVSQDFKANEHKSQKVNQNDIEQRNSERENRDEMLMNFHQQFYTIDDIIYDEQQ